MSMHHVQYMLQLLVLVVNSDQSQIYRVTHSHSSRPFLLLLWSETLEESEKQADAVNWTQGICVAWGLVVVRLSQFSGIGLVVQARNPGFNSW